MEFAGALSTLQPGTIKVNVASVVAPPASVQVKALGYMSSSFCAAASRSVALLEAAVVSKQPYVALKLPAHTLLGLKPRLVQVLMAGPAVSME